MGLERVFQQPVALPSGITVKVLTLDQEPISVKLDINDTLAVAKVSPLLKADKAVNCTCLSTIE